MKRLSLTPILPATAIAVGFSAIASQPSQAADYRYEVSDNYYNAAYADRLALPNLDRAYRRDAPAYHYAYYAIARPEYLL